VDHAREIGVFDTSTWTLRDEVDINSIKADSVANSKCQMMRAEFYYLRKHLDSINDKYEGWNYWHMVDGGRRLDDGHPLEYLSVTDFGDAMSIDGARSYLWDCNAIFDDDSKTLTVLRDGRTVLEYAIQDSINANPEAFKSNPRSFFRVENDSVMIIILDMSGRDKDGTFDVYDISTYDIKFFGK
ncbi:MAG: hypothetical protein K6F33_15595, partial [Bacteroidales bacterium]|nr:hypothetical protein [Bacteroidales bacterium]